MIQRGSSFLRWFRRNPSLKCYKEIVVQSNTLGNSLCKAREHIKGSEESRSKGSV